MKLKYVLKLRLHNGYVQKNNVRRTKKRNVPQHMFGASLDEILEDEGNAATKLRPRGVKGLVKNYWVRRPVFGTDIADMVDQLFLPCNWKFCFDQQQIQHADSRERIAETPELFSQQMFNQLMDEFQRLDILGDV